MVRAERERDAETKIPPSSDLALLLERASTESSAISSCADNVALFVRWQMCLAKNINLWKHG